ncbi:oocyte zinc finger protein XlCOF15-like [Ruditapes philippinarum]|uniref:oocyte zinc finger protein XlCOF15-like n=1 Tax=Ruditapes philippinarum TaxID=129788 RepID=UPI00295A604E|nr:oocyte zinc finger protein XlCOF15-like [Ruditapes philippinarum]
MAPLDGSFLDVSLEETVNSEIFDCDICGRGYKTKALLKRHLRKHSSEETFECTRCTQYFSSQKALDDHIKSKHNEKNHLCVTCGKSFMTKSNLNSHTKLIHPRVDDAKSSTLMSCPFKDCKLTFNQKEKYQDHMNTHTGIKPYSCAQCERKFHNRYIKSKHEKSCLGLSVNTCDVCNKDLCDKSSLKRHKDAQHSGKRFACLCGKNFAYYSSLLKHKKEKKH